MKAGAPANNALLWGARGTGKSAISKALGNETGRPTLMLDPGSLLGSLVGQTEERTRRALRIIDAFGPSVHFLLLDTLALDLYAGFGFSPVGFDQTITFALQTIF